MVCFPHMMLHTYICVSYVICLKQVTTKDVCLHVQVSFHFTFTLMSSSIFVGYMDGIAAVPLN